MTGVSPSWTVITPFGRVVSGMDVVIALNPA